MSKDLTIQELESWLPLLEMFSDKHVILHGAAGEKAMDVGDVLEIIRSHIVCRAVTVACCNKRTYGPKTPSINVEGRDFYELCQAYRWAQPDPVPQFEALKEYIKTGKLPWPSYDEEELRLDATNDRQEKA